MSHEPHVAYFRRGQIRKPGHNAFGGNENVTIHDWFRVDECNRQIRDIKQFLLLQKGGVEESGDRTKVKPENSEKKGMQALGVRRDNSVVQTESF